MFYMNESATQQVRRRCPVRRRRLRAPRRSSARRADRPAAGCASPQLLSSRRSSIRGCQSPGAGRCITAPGKVSGSRRFYVIIRGTAWSGGAVATATADAPFPPLADASGAETGPRAAAALRCLWPSQVIQHQRFLAPDRPLTKAYGWTVRDNVIEFRN